jgi:hypothetical protein
LAHTFDANVPFYFAIARAINAVVGTAMVVLRIDRSGIFETDCLRFGLLFAFFPHIRHTNSHLITPDIPTACITLAMMLVSIRLIKKYSRRQFVLLVFLCVLNVWKSIPV